MIQASSLKILLTMLSIIHWGIISQAQEKTGNHESNDWYVRLIPEAGFHFPVHQVKDHIAIRQNINALYDDQLGSMLQASTIGLSSGCKAELANDRFKSGISLGLRYTSYKTRISGSVAASSDFLYLRYGQGENETKYARIRSLSERNDYIGLPVEIRYSLLHYQDFRFTVRIGMEIGISRTFQENEIDFHNKDMKPNAAEVLQSVIVPTKALNTNTYALLGAEYGKQGKTGLAFEVFLPGNFSSNNHFVLSEGRSFYGMKFSVIVPITEIK